MTRSEFQRACAGGFLILDGATGTELIKRGMPAGVCPELWVGKNPQAICDIHNAYISAGSNIVYAPTFGGNRCKLAEFGLEKDLPQLVASLVRIAKENVGNRALVFGDIAPTGRFVEPFGDLPFEEAIDHILIIGEEEGAIKRFERYSPDYYFPISDHSPAYIDVEF
jgi:5-methyltetrahydrofolate--homocysteine methyltransferase